MNENKDLLFKINPAPWNKLIKKEILINYQILFPTDYRSEDLAFSIMLLSHCDEISIVNQPLYYYLANRLNNVSSAYDERILHTLLALETIMSYYKETNKFEIKNVKEIVLYEFHSIGKIITYTLVVDLKMLRI